MSAWKQVGTSVGMFFLGLEKTFKAFANLATWADEKTGSFVDDARVEREQEMLERQIKLAVVRARANAAGADLTVVATREAA